MHLKSKVPKCQASSKRSNLEVESILQNMTSLLSLIFQQAELVEDGKVPALVNNTRNSMAAMITKIISEISSDNMVRELREPELVKA